MKKAISLLLSMILCLWAINANNLSVIGIYPAKKSNRNQKNNAQKESIGLCKKRIDKMEMPTKSK